MNFTANVVYYTSKTLANGEHPLMIRYCKDGKKKYKSLGVSVNPQFWNFEKNKLKTSCPNYQYIKKLISDTEKELTEQIVKLKSEKKELTISSLADNDNKKVKPKTVDELFQEQINHLELSGRNNYAKSVKQLYNSLLEYNGHLDITFSELDTSWLRKYEISLREKKLAENTIGIRFRTLRAIYNIAIDENIVSAAILSDFHETEVQKANRIHKVISNVNKRLREIGEELKLPLTLTTYVAPSGVKRPSIQDDMLTSRIKEACKSVELRLLDHIIVTPEDGYYSYCDEGKL